MGSDYILFDFSVIGSSILNRAFYLLNYWKFSYIETQHFNLTHTLVNGSDL